MYLYIYIYVLVLKTIICDPLALTRLDPYEYKGIVHVPMAHLRLSPTTQRSKLHQIVAKAAFQAISGSSFL